MRKEVTVCKVDLEPDGYREGMYNYLRFCGRGRAIGRVYVMDDLAPYKPPLGYDCIMVAKRAGVELFREQVQYDPLEGIAHVPFDNRVLSSIATWCHLEFSKDDDVIQTKKFLVFSYR